MNIYIPTNFSGSIHNWGIGDGSCKEINGIDSIQLESYTTGREFFGGRLR